MLVSSVNLFFFISSTILDRLKELKRAARVIERMQHELKHFFSRSSATELIKNSSNEMCAQHVRVCVRVCLISMWMLHAKKTNENPKSAFTNKVNCASILVTQISTMQCFTSCWIPLPFLLICCHIPQFYTELNSRMEFCSFWFQVKKKDDTLSLTVWTRENMYKWLDLYMHWALVLGEKICASNEKGTENIFQKKRSRRCYFNSIPLRAHAKNERKFMKYSYRTKWMRKRVALTLSHTLWYSH